MIHDVCVSCVSPCNELLQHIAAQSTLRLLSQRFCGSGVRTLLGCVLRVRVPAEAAAAVSAKAGVSSEGGLRRGPLASSCGC